MARRRYGEAKRAEGARYSLTVTAQEFDAPPALGAYVDQQLQGVGALLADFEMGRREEATVAQHPCVQLDYMGTGQSGALYQSQAYLLRGRSIIIITGTASAAQAEHAQTAVDRLLSSLAFE